MRITDGSADSKLMDYEVDDDGEGLSPEDDTDWLELSRSCYDNAVDYDDSHDGINVLWAMSGWEYTADVHH